MIHLPSLLAFLRDVCGACRPPADDLTAVAGVYVDDYGYRTGRAATPADLAYQQLVTEVVLDAANEWLHDNGDTLPESWLLLDVEVER